MCYPVFLILFENKKTDTVKNGANKAFPNLNLQDSNFHYVSKVSLPNPVIDFWERAEDHTMKTMISRIHGDLNLDNLLIGLSLNHSPEDAFIIDLADSKTDAPSVIDLARIETEFWHEVLTYISNEQEMAHNLTSAQRIMESSKEIPASSSAIVRNTVLFVNSIRREALNILEGGRDNYVMVDYMQALYFLHCRALAYSSIQNSGLKCRASFLGAANALDFLLRLERGTINCPPCMEIDEDETKIWQLCTNRAMSSRKENFSENLSPLAHIPNQFRNFIVEKTSNFVGREYVFKEFERFISKNKKGYFILQGDPGEGKSAILANYAKQNGCIAHFNIRAEGITRPSQFFKSIISQLAARFKIDAQLFQEVSDEGENFKELLEQVAEQLSINDRLIIAIDALDEVKQATSTGNILFLPLTLPNGVYFFMTRRRVDDIPFFTMDPQFVFDLKDYKLNSDNDIRKYLTNATKQHKLDSWISAQTMTIEDIIELLVKKSDRNFMYLYYVIPEIEQGIYQNLKIEQLPVGLSGYYDDHWQRMGMTKKPLPRDRINIVYIMCEIQEPVSLKLILDYAREGNANLDAITVQNVLNDWQQFLHTNEVDGECRYSIYHQSFQEFLYSKKIIKAAGVTKEMINRMIADNLFRELF